MSQSETPPLPLGLVLPLGLGMIISFASSYYLLGVVAEPMAVTTGAKVSDLFSALSGAFLLAALSSIPAGRWTDARGGREVLIVASLLLALALILLGTAQTPWTAMVAIVLLGLGMGIGFYAPANALLVAVLGTGARRAMTAVSLMGACGGAIGWPLTMTMMEVVGWRGACLIWAAGHGLICIPLFWMLLPRTRGQVSTRAGDRVSWDRPMVQMALLFAGAWWVATAFAAHLPRLLVGLGLTPVEAALAASGMALSALAARMVFLVAPPKLSPVLMVRLASLMNPLGVCVALMGGKGAAMAVAIGQGAGNGLLSVASGILPLHVFGATNYGQRQVAVLLPARFVQAAAPMSFGLVLEQSIQGAMGLSVGICMAMTLLTLGLGTKTAIKARDLVADRA